MKVVIASDSFKGCLSSLEVADSIESGIRMVCPGAEVVKIELADGGEGTASVIGKANFGEYINISTYCSAMREMLSSYYVINGDVAVIDVSSSCGMGFTDQDIGILERASYGFGLVLRDAYERGCRKFVIGLGGSDTCDAGIGLLHALGVNSIGTMRMWVPTAGDMKNIESLKLTSEYEKLKDCQFIVLSDVDNPLFGPEGAAEIFAPQKGATPEEVKTLDAGLRHIAEMTKSLIGKDFSFYPGAGAAGGLGWAFKTFFDARIEPGAQFVMDSVGFNDAVMDADIVITGEGRIDRQTLSGKLPLAVCRRARGYRVPTIALAGSIGDVKPLLDAGFAGVFSISTGPMSLAEALEPQTAQSALCESTASLIKLWMNK